MMAEKIKILLIKNKLSVADLAKAQSTTPQNLYNKFKRDNFSEQELREIAEILGAKLEINFVKDGERI
ncbi:transcriptional regulator [Anaerovorax sp. IOR16]|uniref:transcriptional regulator n=1 Tax=Anaerovorax sp. IOR16 TaxID=2773458 RepID=UPI0019D24D5C|nr:transcriptional regulator [Anaerovorax sp. IOR16]